MTTAEVIKGHFRAGVAAKVFAIAHRVPAAARVGPDAPEAVGRPEAPAGYQISIHVRCLP